MERTDLINDIVKMFFINVCLSYISCRIMNYKVKNINNKIIILGISFFISILYSILIKFVNPISFLLMLYLLYAIVFGYITKIELYKSITITAIAISITYVIYIVSLVIAAITIYLLKFSNDYKSMENFIFIAIYEILLISLLFKNKRFKNGFYFLKRNNKSINVLAYSISLSIIIMFVYNLIHLYINDEVNAILFTFTICIAFVLVMWIQTQITKQYKRNMKDRTIEIQKKEIDEQLKIIEKVKEENLKLAKVIHKYNSRLSALELGIKNVIEQNSKTEFAEELVIILGETKEISKNFSEETTITNNKLPLTNIISIDNMFKYFEQEANKKDINFNLIINESVKPLLEIIDKAKLETLIGDHLKDAIIAVNERENSYKSILAILGVSEDCYEFSVCDTGIEFEIDTLLKLGLEQITTHKDAGGSGIGFMTTFETLKETKASLIIEEYNPNTTNYTKSVTIRFDGKNEYRIYSYRADEIKEKSKTKRIIVEEL